MSKFNAAGTTTTASPIGTEALPSGSTFEGGDGYKRDTKGELFLLAVSSMVGENTFYESADKRDTRYVDLIHKATLEDPDWTARLLAWLRSDGNMRSASLVGAAEFAKARLDAGLHGMSRQVISSVLQRADEPGEMLAYWASVHGKTIPKPVKRGVADAVKRLYSEKSFLKYDSNSKGFRFGDVLNLVHPEGVDGWQADLFGYALDVRHGHADDIPVSLKTIMQRWVLTQLPVEQRRASLALDGTADILNAAGMTWEALAGWLQGPMDATAWEMIIPSMGYMALLRNLRNFDEAGVSNAVAATVAARLADPEQVAKSRQFPFRFLSAYEAAPSRRWGQALDNALQASLSNLPAMKGRSLILVDTSASMTNVPYSARSKVTPAKAAAVFGIALGAKGEDADVVGFASGTFRHAIPWEAGVIREVDRFLRRIGEVGHGTDIAGALRAAYDAHDRVFIISDMQTIGSGVSESVPPHVPIYGFNLGGYEHAAMAMGNGNRHEFGGLTDATFRMVPLLEAGRNADWPF